MIQYAKNWYKILVIVQSQHCSGWWTGDLWFQIICRYDDYMGVTASQVTGKWTFLSLYEGNSPRTVGFPRKDLRQRVVTAWKWSLNVTMTFCTQVMYSQMFTFTEYETNAVKRYNAYGKYTSFKIVNFLMWSNTKTNRSLHSIFGDKFHVIALKSVWGFANSEKENTKRYLVTFFDNSSQLQQTVRFKVSFTKRPGCDGYVVRVCNKGKQVQFIDASHQN